jgi:hypothetical protein
MKPADAQFLVSTSRFHVWRITSVVVALVVFAIAFGRIGHGPAPLDVAGITLWARSLGVKEIATPCAPMGETASALEQARIMLGREGVRLVQIRREFDQRAWPHASAGFFRFREQIPLLVAGLARA